MVADELACALVAEHVPPGASVLDPFCGSGRLLAAADAASLRVGFDINPLAWLLSRAKLSNASADVLSDVLRDMPHGRASADGTRIEVADGRKVEWFAPATLRELERIVSWINRLRLAEAEGLVVAAALSATVREVSFARQMGWKLHRLESASRESFLPCPWDRLARRLRYCVHDLRTARPMSGSVRIELADLRMQAGQPHPAGTVTRFDVVLTSPPYGDSRTTVQYGAASALCLSVVKGLAGFEELAVPGGAIDARCLGGRSKLIAPVDDLPTYWAGTRATPDAEIYTLSLPDAHPSCTAAAASLAPGGKAVYVVGRRSVGGQSLQLDRFTADRLEAAGLRLLSSAVRPLSRKRVPSRINRFGRSTSACERARGVIPTMASEIILVAEKARDRSAIGKIGIEVIPADRRAGQASTGDPGV